MVQYCGRCEYWNLDYRQVDVELGRDSDIASVIHPKRSANTTEYNERGNNYYQDFRDKVCNVINETNL